MTLRYVLTEMQQSFRQISKLEHRVTGTYVCYLTFFFLRTGQNTKAVDKTKNMNNQVCFISVFSLIFQNILVSLQAHIFPLPSELHFFSMQETFSLRVPSNLSFPLSEKMRDLSSLNFR